MYKIPAKTLFVGHSFVFMPECHSTNEEALKLLQKQSCSEGTVVITDNQTAGKGQRGNKWISDPGKNLTFSIVLTPRRLDPKDHFQLSMMLSLGVCDYLKTFLNTFLNTVRVKWPNDILISRKKICGILIENIIKENRVHASVCGVGLNVNQVAWPFEEATSMKLVLGVDLGLESVLEPLLECIEARYLRMRNREDSSLKDDYLTHLYRLGEEGLYESGGTSFSGIIRGVDKHGRLILTTSAGERSFDAKELTYL